jgi:hypothetical protein
MNKQKTVVLTLSVLLVLSLVSVNLAGYIGDTSTVMRLGKFSLFPYSYVIEPFNSTHVQSVNASGYEYQSTNVSAVREFAIGNMTTGTILYKAGTYNFTNSLKGKSCIQEYGEGNATVFRPQDASVSPLFDFGVLTDSELEKVRLSNFKIDMCGYSNTIAISLKNTKDSEFDHLLIYRYHIGFYVEGGSGSYYSFWNNFHNNLGVGLPADTTKAFFFLASRAWDSWISYCCVDSYYGYGIWMQDNVTGWNIDDCWFAHTTNAIYIWAGQGNVNSIHLRTSWLDLPTADAVYVNVSTGWGFANSEFAHNVFVAVSAGFNNFFFNGSGGYVTRVTIENNFDNYQTKAYIANKTGTFVSFENVNFYNNQMRAGASGTYNGFNFAYNDIRNDIACITERWGVNSTAQDGGLQSHGLSGTPSCVFVTSGNTTINCICSVGSLGAVYFTYNLEDDAGASLTGQTVFWVAYYKPD